MKSYLIVYLTGKVFNVHFCYSRGEAIFKAIDKNNYWMLMNHWYSSIPTILLSSRLFPQIFVSSETLPQNFILSQNYPNQFKPDTRFKYKVITPAFCTLTVYNILGKQVALLVNENQNTSTSELDLNTNNSQCNSFLSGNCIAKLRLKNQAKSINYY